MQTTKPSKRGQYVIIRGARHCVTGREQLRRAAALLRVGDTASITRWDGLEWHETGLVIHGTAVGGAS